MDDLLNVVDGWPVLPIDANVPAAGKLRFADAEFHAREGVREVGADVGRDFLRPHSGFRRAVRDVRILRRGLDPFDLGLKLGVGLRLRGGFLGVKAAATVAQLREAFRREQRRMVESLFNAADPDAVQVVCADVVLVSVLVDCEPGRRGG